MRVLTVSGCDFLAFKLRSYFASRQVNQNLAAFMHFKCFSLGHLRVFNNCTYYVIRRYPGVLVTCVWINEGGDLIAEGLFTGSIELYFQYMGPECVPVTFSKLHELRVKASQPSYRKNIALKL
jgi:hypothetical protein